ncbi:hypothetical protein ACTXG6_43385 [Pseudonocardia sp. Cha107L01]|uniref:hypothetical protein n=1 Tax=Pseudonocardia sp. Cha107L01 TaxID=3457576 RepID=UPI00403EDADF
MHGATDDLGKHSPARRANDSVPGAGVLPVAPALAKLLPDGGLRRGSTVRVRSSTSLLLALIAEASRQETWCAVVGIPDLGLVAAHEAGIDLSRLALIPNPGADLVAVTAALLDGLDLVAVGGTQQLRAGDRQRLTARARQRGAVLVATDDWPGADVELGLTPGGEGWDGLSQDGHGRLRSRRVQVRATGRGAQHRGRKATLLLPGPAGAAAAVDWSQTASSADHTRVPVPRERQAG